jgi:uncharacterized protein (TIGR02147 family)
VQSLLEQAAAEIRPSGYLDYRLYLESLYLYLKQAAGSYSYQRFSKDLGFNAPTVMHQVVRGYRPLTVKAAERIAGALGLDGAEKKFFLTLVAFCNAKTSLKREQLFETLLAQKREVLPEAADRDALAYFSEWYHPVIWEMISSKTFKPDPKWIAERMIPRIKPEQAEAALALLTRLGLIVFDKDQGTYRQTQLRVSTGHRVQGMALVSYHQRMIEHGKAALTRIDGQRRDISAVTVNVNEETARKLKSMIHAFQLQLLDAADRSGGGDQVYQINIQLFPFTDEDAS